MKHLQNLLNWKLFLKDNSVNAPGFENGECNGTVQCKLKQTIAATVALSYTQTTLNILRDYCRCILIVMLTGHATVGKFRNAFEKKFLGAKEAFEVLRTIYLTGRIKMPAQQHNIQALIAALVNHFFHGDIPEKLLAQFKTIAPALCDQIQIAFVTSAAVASAVWP